MRLKPKRRIILIVATLAILAVAAFALLFVRNWQKQRITDELFVKGQDAFKARNYYDAMYNSGQYLARARNSAAARANPRHADALLAYAESRRLIEEPDGSNLEHSISWYQQYLDRRPDDAAVKLTLLKVYNARGLRVEAKDLALRARPRDLSQATSEHIPVLLQEAAARVDSRAFDAETDKVIDRLLQLAPLDPEANILRFTVNKETNRREESTARVNQLLKDFPQSGEVTLIAALSNLVEPTVASLETANSLLCQAAGVDPKGKRIKPSPLSTETSMFWLIRTLGGLEYYDLEMLVLEDAADRIKSDSFEKAFLRRLWQEGSNAVIIERTAKLDPASVDVDPDLVGLRALALQRSGKPQDAAAIAAALKTRGGSYRASGWADAIPLIGLDPAPRTSEHVAAWREVVKGSPTEPIFHAFHGEALAAIGRHDEARQAWQQASGGARSWYFPRVRIVETLLLDNRSEDAIAAADEARRTGGNRVLVLVVWFEAQAARLQAGSSGQTPASLSLEIDEAITKLAEGPQNETLTGLRERLLVPQVLMLAKAGQTDRAQAAARAIITAEPPPKVETLQRLAAVSANERLGVEAECMRRVDALSGGQSLTVAFVKAIELADAGKSGEGLKLLRTAAETSPNDVIAQMAVARYLERTADPADALAEWIKTADAHPKELDVQRACLQAEVCAADSQFIERTLERYAALIGSEPGPTDAVPTIAKARALMYGTPSKADRDKAVAMLGALSTAHPKLVEAKRVLAAAVGYADPAHGIAAELPRAAALLAEAAIIEPANTQVAIELASVLQRQGQFDKAREQLSRVATDANRPDAARLRAAELLIGQNDKTNAATQVLNDLIKKRPAETTAGLRVMLAEGYLVQGRDAEAASVYNQLAESGANDVNSIFMTARYFAARAEPERAKPALDRLEKLQLDPGERDFVVARLASESGDADAMTAAYERAVAAAPKRADFWRQYTAGLLRMRKAEDAFKVSERAIAILPKDVELNLLHTQASMMRNPDSAADFSAFKQALADDQKFAYVAAIVAAIEEATKSGGTVDAAGLLKLADQFPEYPPLQLFVARRIAFSDPSRTSVLLSRAMSVNPTDPMPARAATEVYAATGRYSDMLAAALEWRQRDRTRSIEVESALAEAYLRTKQPAKGLEVLSPRVAAYAARPTDPVSLNVLTVQAGLLLAVGREPEARALLAPNLPVSFEWRCRVWLPLAVEATPSLAVAKSWLEQLRAAIPNDESNELAAWAAAPATLVKRFPDQATQLRAETLANLLLLAESPKTATGLVYESIGMMHHNTPDLVKAEAAYRKALEKDPKLPITLNNLANILFERSALEEAKAFAAEAAKLNDTNPDYVDTLAEAHKRLSDAALNKGDAAAATANAQLAAEAYDKVAELQFGNPKPLQAAANMYERAGDTPAAMKCYQTLLGVRGLPPQAMAQIKNNLAMALIRTVRSRSSPETVASDTQAAGTFANEAIQLMPHPAFFDTLGWAELQAKRLNSAGEAFAQSIKLFQEQKKNDEHSPVIGLAIVQAQGTGADRSAAQRVANDMAAKKLSAEDAARLDELKKLLASSP